MKCVKAKDKRMRDSDTTKHNDRNVPALNCVRHRPSLVVEFAKVWSRRAVKKSCVVDLKYGIFAITRTADVKTPSLSLFTVPFTETILSSKALAYLRVLACRVIDR
jgi:hypothetical protein